MDILIVSKVIDLEFEEKMHQVYSWNPTGFIMWDTQVIWQKIKLHEGTLQKEFHWIMTIEISSRLACVEVCNICRDIVVPISLEEEWRQRWFGHFKCTANKGKSKKPCGRTWTSSWAWTVDNQIQTTKCKACKLVSHIFGKVLSICMK